MTEPDAPTAMTLEEAMLLAAERKWKVTFYGYPYSVLIEDDFGDDIAHEGNWPESFSEALGYPVVERDPAAELVEALQKIAHGAPATEDQSWYEGKDTPYYAERRTHYGFARIARAALAKWKERRDE